MNYLEHFLHQVFNDASFHQGQWWGRLQGTVLSRVKQQQAGGSWPPELSLNDIGEGPGDSAQVVGTGS